MGHMFLYFWFFQYAWRWAETNIVIHAWDSLSRPICYSYDIIWICKFDSTIPDLEYPTKCSHWLFDSWDIWTEIFSTVLEPLTSLDEFWNGRIRDLDIRKVLIILHENIVFRCEVFDEIGLENKSLHFCRTDDDLDISYSHDHLLLRSGEISRTIEIWLDSILQMLRLPNIDDLPRLILHLIYSRICRKIFEEFLEMFSESASFVSSWWVKQFR